MIVIAGLMVAPVYNLMFRAIGLGTTQDRVEIIRYAMAEHFRVFKRLPLPSDLDASPNDPDYYDEAALADLLPSPLVNGANGNQYVIGALPIEALRKATGCADPSSIVGIANWQLNIIKTRLFGLKDRLQTASTQSANDQGHRNNDPQKYGCITRNHLLDEHGNKFLYAVSLNATNVDTFEPEDANAGQLLIENSVSGNMATNTAQWYVVLSHGEDGRGAYSKQGGLVAACAGIGRDIENCNNDHVFVSMQQNFAAGATFFDDKIDFSLTSAMTEINYWEWDNGGGNFNMSFDENSRLILTNELNATAPDADDQLVVDDGNVIVSEDGIEGGRVRTQNIEAPSTAITSGQNIQSGNSFTSPKYCYTAGC